MLVAEERDFPRRDDEPDTVGGDRGAEPREPTRPLDEHATDEALAVDTVVVPERGRWVVEIVVIFADGVVRKRIDSYATRRRAEISAQLIKRAAERDIGGGPIHG